MTRLSAAEELTTPIYDERKKSNHQANIVRLGEPRVHTNADSLELFDIGGYQVVVRKGQFTAGNLAVYIQPDSVVPQTEPFKFIWEDRAELCKDDYPGQINGYLPVPERRRRITVRRFRKEWSEGLLMPLSDFPNMFYNGENTGLESLVSDGEDVSTLLGITHWEGEEVEATQGTTDSRPRRKYPRTVKGWFYFALYKLFGVGRKEMIEELAFDVPKFDVESIKNHAGALIEGEDVIITEKIHGSQGRFFFKEGKMYAGSRNLWKSETSPCVWRKVLRDQPWIEEWCRENEEHVLYGEVVPTQKGYRYGCQKDKADFYVFDIRDAAGHYWLKGMVFDIFRGLHTVPVLYTGPWAKTLLPKYGTGNSLVPFTNTPIEGCVITVTDPTRWERGIGRVQLKYVNNEFLEKDSK